MEHLQQAERVRCALQERSGCSSSTSTLPSAVSFRLREASACMILIALHTDLGRQR